MANYPDTAWTLIYLLSCAVNENECKLKPDEIDFDGLYLLASNHVLCSAVAYALESAGISEGRFEQAKLKAKRRLGLFDLEREKIGTMLNEAGIWFLPLKGIVLKDCYPRYGMREMSDNDILCNSTKMAEVRQIMESLGYRCESYGEWHHDSYQKPPTLSFEMHRRLFAEDVSPAAVEYYATVFDRLVQRSGCEYAFTDEDFYIYMLAHTYKHFSHNGTGLRPLLDIYVYLKKHPELDFDYIGRELEKLQISRFGQQSRDLAEKLFSLRKLSEEDTELLSIYFNSSLYGSSEQGAYNYLTRQLEGKDTKRVKAKYFFDRLFLHGDDLKTNYPFFAEHKWLLPALYIYRPFKGMIIRPKEIVTRIKDVVKYRSPKKQMVGLSYMPQ